MSILGNTLSKKTASAETGTPMLTPEQVVDQLRALRTQIPEFVQLPNNRELKQIKRLARVNVDFAREAMNAVGASDIVQNVIGNTPDELHQAEDEVARWTAVETELRSMLRGVVAANLVRRHRIGHAALQAYNVSRQLVRQEDHANLLPHVETMSRLPRYGRRRLKPPAAPPADPTKPADPAKPPVTPSPIKPS
ncbi:MAG TPA: hypothetical protein VGQ36_23955 [Thermoanaerobaculia bacterium]|nr:hypothetical protein [Thermoanaerobaculia bacterium]